VQYISEALVCTMDCHANILYNYQTKTPKYAAMAVHENFFFHDTSSPGNRTTHNYPNHAQRFVQYSGIWSIKEEIMGVLLIISNYQDPPGSLSKQEKD